MAIGSSFPEVKRPGREAEQWFPSSAKVRISGAASPLPHTL